MDRFPQRLVGWLMVVGWLLGCTDHPGEVIQQTRMQMGTLVTVTVWHDPRQGPTRDATVAAIAQAFAEMDRIERMMSSHRPDSPVGMLNRSVRGDYQEVPPEVARVVGEALRIQSETGGRFDPGLWELSGLWGFSREPPGTAPPAASELAAFRQRHPGLGGVGLRREGERYWLRLANQAVGLDLGALAKGYAVDCAIEVLRRLQVIHAIVNAGGNLRVIGSKGALPWRIGVQHPRREQGVAVAASELAVDRAMVTSGDYERYFIHEGVRYHHILDPATGQPSRSGLISVTIQADTAMLADAISTAVLVMGVEQGMRWLKAMPSVEALLILEDGSTRQTDGYIGQVLRN